MAYSIILVAIDTTDEADEVLSAAKEIMDDDKSTISIVSVIKPLANFYADLYSVLDNRDGIAPQAVERATAWISSLAKRHGIKTPAVDVVIGTPAVEIRRLAEKLGADLIVLGTHGQHGLGLMLGSTANAVLHGAPCDVLAVKVRSNGQQR